LLVSPLSPPPLFSSLLLFSSLSPHREDRWCVGFYCFGRLSRRTRCIRSTLLFPLFS
jgi:hypothetical protein